MDTFSVNVLQYWIFVVISSEAIVNFCHQNAWIYISQSITNEKNGKSIEFRWYHRTQLLYTHSITLLKASFDSTRCHYFQQNGFVFFSSSFAFISLSMLAHTQNKTKNTTEIDCSPIPRIAATQIHTWTSKILIMFLCWYCCCCCFLSLSSGYNFPFYFTFFSTFSNFFRTLRSEGKKVHSMHNLNVQSIQTFWMH